MCAPVPTEKSRNGHIAVAADGSSWIWTPDRSEAYLTRDKGASWQSCRGLPKNIRVIADKVNPQRFYAVDAVAEILYSRVEDKTVSTLLPVMKKICGLQLMMVCTALLLQKNLISVLWIRYVPSMLLVSARQSQAMIILPSI